VILFLIVWFDVPDSKFVLLVTFALGYEFIKLRANGIMKKFDTKGLL